jgi:hypothetical protein
LDLSKSRVPEPQALSASGVADVRKEVQKVGGPLASTAFKQLLAGEIDLYVANLCPTDRLRWSNPSFKSSLKSMGQILAREQIRLGDFSTVETTFARLRTQRLPEARMAGAPESTREVNAVYGRDMGKLCLRALDIGA